MSDELTKKYWGQSYQIINNIIELVNNNKWARYYYGIDPKGIKFNRPEVWNENCSCCLTGFIDCCSYNTEKSNYYDQLSRVLQDIIYNTIFYHYYKGDIPSIWEECNTSTWYRIIHFNDNDADHDTVLSILNIAKDKVVMLLGRDLFPYITEKEAEVNKMIDNKEKKYSLS